MGSRRRTTPTPPTHAAAAAALEIEPSATERDAGYETPASLVELVALHSDGRRWVVVSARGSKHYLPLAPADPPETSG